MIETGCCHHLWQSPPPPNFCSGGQLGTYKSINFTTVSYSQFHQIIQHSCESTVWLFILIIIIALRHFFKEVFCCLGKSAYQESSVVIVLILVTTLLLQDSVDFDVQTGAFFFNNQSIFFTMKEFPIRE